MTAQNENPDEEPKGFPDITEAIRELMAPYIPVKDEKEADTYFTTKEIMTALEDHYGIPMGTMDVYNEQNGFILVQYLKNMGFTCVNTGNLVLQWIMKKSS